MASCTVRLLFDASASAELDAFWQAAESPPLTSSPAMGLGELALTEFCFAAGSGPAFCFVSASWETDWECPAPPQPRMQWESPPGGKASASWIVADLLDAWAAAEFEAFGPAKL